ncbi:MAG TPA: hypothetical protein VK921_17130 [Anditalea sp.]|nr:hypothetical protein [Anditalea sp.]
MIKSIFIGSAFFFLSFSIIAQTSDKLHLLEEVKEVNIEEVGQNTIKYRHVNENTSYVVSKHQVKKIEFASGREEIYETPFKPVNTINEYENVYITYIPQDIDGMHSKGEVYSKAAGVTALASINNVKNRATRKIKIEAAMLGANVIFLGNMYQRGNQMGNENVPANTTMTTLSGTAFNTEKLDINKLKSLVENSRFHLYQKTWLNRNAWDKNSEIPVLTDNKGNIILLTFDKVFERDGDLYVTSKDIKSRSKELKVIRGDENSITLMERDDKRTTNFYLLSERDKRVAKGIELMEMKQAK